MISEGAQHRWWMRVTLAYGLWAVAAWLYQRELHPPHPVESHSISRRECLHSETVTTAVWTARWTKDCWEFTANSIRHLCHPQLVVSDALGNRKCFLALALALWGLAELSGSRRRTPPSQGSNTAALAAPSPDSPDS
ncbi:MAG: hypothetical protein DWH91_03045 [Planctomycetota bacterium]|nr:MAG: hypothetical protein DWH91_03045 [Planctomycetota bacterium]